MPIALLIHGGAGVIRELPAAQEEAIRKALDDVLRIGYTVLSRGGSALDAVTEAVVALEECPYFNAGKGAVFTADGKHELDATIMEGHTRRAGAVGDVRTVRNPILLARAVMEETPHVMLVSDGAERFADSIPALRRVPNEWFDTETRRSQWKEAQAAAADHAKPYGTVGAVALDEKGHLAAATSTGGRTNKMAGRIGDSVIVGAGTYADSRVAVSCTGDGEFFIRAVAAREISARLRWARQPLREASEAVICEVIPKLGGDGGAVCIDAEGNLAMPISSSGMYRGWVHSDGRRGVAILREEVDLTAPPPSSPL